MKKFISLLIASAMVVSLVPATAFAGYDVSATAKIVGSETVKETSTGVGVLTTDVPELQITIASATYSGNNADFANADMYYSTGAGNVRPVETIDGLADIPSIEFEIALDDAEFVNKDASQLLVSVEGDDVSNNGKAAVAFVTDFDADGDEAVVTVYGKVFADDKIIVKLAVDYDLDAGDYATVSVDSDAVEADDLVFLTIADTGIEASVKDIVYVAEDEGTTLEKITIEEDVDNTFISGDILVLELSNGFEFGGFNYNGTISTSAGHNASVSGLLAGNTSLYDFDDEFAYFYVDGSDEVVIENLYIYADGADEGDICTMEITLYQATGNGGSSALDKQYSSDKLGECEVEVAEVCDYTVQISVDEDDDVPVFYSGVNSDNYGLNDGGDHESIEVTITESFPGAWSYRDEWELTLPEGVYVIDMDVDSDNWKLGTTTLGKDTFKTAYQDGSYESFVFEKRSFTETTDTDKEIEIVFTMTLTAAPDFEGDVVLGFVGDSVTEDEVVIAEFVSPYTVEASQNDVIIDYRNTPIDTPVIITEAEAELWSDDMIFYLSLDSNMAFDSEGSVAVNEDSSMEVDVEDGTYTISVEITEESDDEAAVLTWEGIELYMERSLPAGAYALDIDTTAAEAFMAEVIFAPYSSTYDTTLEGGDYETDEVHFVGDVINGSDEGDYDYKDDGYSIEVSEKFVNIVTAGSDQATTFTTKVIVPVGESYIYSGGTQIELDVPAYISADGYTMLPVRAVATAIGVSTSNVLWDSATSQVTIIYGTKTIAMVIGQSYMTVNGTAIPTSACPEIVDGRTFLPLRDLATALSVTTIDWDADTRTASLN